MRTYLSCFLFLFMASSAQAGEKLTAIDDAIKAGIARGDCPGAVVLVLHQDKIVYRKAHGNRSRQPEHTLMTEDTVFDLASLTKPIATALAIIQASAQSWQDVNTSYFTVNAYQFTGAPGDSQPVLALDGQNSVLFVTDLTGATFPPGVIAFVRSFVDNTDGHTVDADMAFNDRDFFGNTTAPAPNPPTPPGGSAGRLIELSGPDAKRRIRSGLFALRLDPAPPRTTLPPSPRSSAG